MLDRVTFGFTIASLAGLQQAWAQSFANASTSTVAPSATANGTAVANPAAFVTTLKISVNDLWDIAIGPVSSANITTTVEATPVPSSSLIPPPFLTTYGWPPGRDLPVSTQNQSWKFPKDFQLGVSGAAFQIEGAAQAEGKGPSVWDKLTHAVKGGQADNSTGDITDNNYYMYKQDIARLAAIGINTYSFSLAWARLFPFGSGPVNELGIAHYNDVIDTCIQYNITPVITLYHWDTPLYLQETYGGWLGDQIVEDFVAYSKIAFARFGDRVKHWYTVNEPIVFCGQYPLPAQYFKNFTIPYQHQQYVCGRNVVLAHAETYHVGKAMMPDSTIAFKNNGGFKIPLTNSTEDAEAVQRAWDYNEGWFADPIYLTGDWPSSLNTYLSTFLPSFTDTQKASIKGTADVFAHDAYTSSFYMAPSTGLSSCIGNSSHPLYPGCFNTTNNYSPDQGSWLVGAAADPHSPWLHKATDWVPALLHYITKTWKPADGIVISEFGFAEPFENMKELLGDILFDPVRSAYFHDYMEAVLRAIAEGVDVRGTLAWSFVDNLEWSSGFTAKFGIQHVNFTSPGLERSYKSSFFEYTGMFKQYVEK